MDIFETLKGDNVLYRYENIRKCLRKYNYIPRLRLKTFGKFWIPENRLRMAKNHQKWLFLRL